MSTAKTPILFLGATGKWTIASSISSLLGLIWYIGYVGGSVLSRLLAHPGANTFDITVFVRDAKKAGIAESKFGLKAVVGSLADVDKIEALAEDAHVIFSCADADDHDSVNAILRGLRKRHTTTGDLPILIHTSGTGVLADRAKGLYASDTIYDDMNADQIESLPDTQLHRDVDLAIVEADKQGYLRSYIVTPSTIYGRPVNPLVQAGFQKDVSIQIPGLIKTAIARGQAGVVGKGVSIWPSVDVEEVADLYIVLFNSIVANPDKVGHGREGYYFGESGEHTWYDISKTISKVLVELGLGKSDEPTTFTPEELAKYFGSEANGDYFGTNSRCRGNRPRSLGWKPQKTTQDMLASIKPEVEAILKTQSQK